MVYITVKASPKYHQMTLEELIYQQTTTPLYVGNETNTITYAREELSEHFLQGFHCDRLIDLLKQFNSDTEYLRKASRQSLYKTYYIPKSSGGLRRIDEPENDLKEALRDLIKMIARDFYGRYVVSGVRPAYYHTSAFAYIEDRQPKDLVKRHVENESRWYSHLDIHNFFGSTTLDYAMQMLSMFFPFCEICKSQVGYDELKKAIELGFLNGVLPQGSPLSPMLSNIIMVPIDFTLANALRSYDGASSGKQHYIYTRYSDDMIISSKYSFNVKALESLVSETFRQFKSPYVMNTAKTHYGSNAGRNFILGMMVNKDDNITIGHKNKKRFHAMLTSFVRDTQNGVHWDRHDIQVLDGLRSYYYGIEGEPIEELVKFVGNKHGVDIRALIKQELNR